MFYWFQESFSVFSAGRSNSRTGERAHSNPEITGFQGKQTSFKFWKSTNQESSKVHMLVEITDTVIKRRCIRGPMHPNLCSRWNSGYRHHVWEPFIVIYHRECTFDFGMQVCKFFTTDHLTHFSPIPLKGFWSEDRQKIRFASFLTQIKSATYLKNLLEEII